MSIPRATYRFAYYLSAGIEHFRPAQRSLQSSIPVSHGRIEAGRALATGPVAVLTSGSV